MMIEIASPNTADDPDVERWLKLRSRCFGDKGDVEDITEG